MDERIKQELLRLLENEEREIYEAEHEFRVAEVPIRVAEAKIIGLLQGLGEGILHKPVKVTVLPIRKSKRSVSR